MLSRSLTRTYRVPVRPSVVWGHLSDPAAVAAASPHPVLVSKPTPGFAAGTRWTEIHDDECDFDSVPWVVAASAPGESFTIDGLQSGARQRVTCALRAVEDGTEVTATLELRPSARAHGSLVERVLVLVVCVSGLGMPVVADAFDRSVAADADHLRGLAT